MAKGYPDWFGISIFPQFGPFRWDYGGVTVIADDETDSIIRVDFKGKTYGGRWLIIDLLDDPDAMTVYTYVDDVEIASDSPWSMYANGFGLGYATPQKMLMLNRRRNRYMGAVRQDITFKESFEIKVANASGGDLTCTANLYCAEIV